MAEFTTPESWLQRFVEEVSSHEMRFKAGTTVAFANGVFQQETAAGAVAGVVEPYLLGSANLTLTAAQSGSVIECGAAEDFVLPAITADLVGTNYEFVVTTTATSLTITAATGDLLKGGVSVMSTGAGVENDAFSADGTDDLIITMNGTTTGGIIGSWVKLTAASATSWLVRGGLIGSGTLVTPFS
jgi:hypothetical protein